MSYMKHIKVRSTILHSLAATEQLCLPAWMIFSYVTYFNTFQLIVVQPHNMMSLAFLIDTVSADLDTSLIQPTRESPPV